MISIIKKLYSVSGNQSKRITKMIVGHVFKGFFEGFVLGSLLFFLLKICQNVFENRAVVPRDIYAVLGIGLIGVVGKIIFGHMANSNRSIASYTLGGEARLRIGDRLKQVNMGFFSTNRLGEVSSGFTTVINNVETLGVFVIENIVAGFIETGIIAIFVLTFDLIAGLIILATLLLTLLCQQFSQAKSDTESGKLQALKINLNAHILEFISGIAVVKSFGKGKEILKDLENSIDNARKGFFNLEKTVILPNFLFAIILRIGSCAIILSAIFRYISKTIPADKTIMLIVISFVVFASFEIVLGLLNVRQMAVVSLNKMTEFQEIKTINDGEKTEIKTPSIELKNVTFSYTDDEVELFKNLNLKIPEYKTTALVGTSGSGKTTVCNLMARFWDVEEGQVLIDNTDVKNYKYDNLLSNFTFVFQDVYLFDDTVKNNIKFGKPDATDEEIIEVAKKARCHDFIMQLPDGYDTQLQEGGSNFSGGERQRISIARAMLKPSKIVILDEATSSVDPETEEELLAALHELLKNKTVVVIAHRLGTIKNADNIIVMDKGKIVQQGKHDELMQQGGLYKDFIKTRESITSWKMV